MIAKRSPHSLNCGCGFLLTFPNKNDILTYGCVSKINKKKKKRREKREK